MNAPCKGCGKAPHPGGCKVGPNTEEQNAALRKYAERVQAKCGICMSPDHELPDCPKASPRVVNDQVECRTEIEKHKAEIEVVLSHLPLVGQMVLAPHTLDISGLHPAMADILRECVKVQSTKGHDYTEGSNDRLNNFREAAAETDEPMEKVWYIYFFKHWKAVRSWVRFGQVESEPIRGRIVDCINYLLLLWLIVREKDPEQT